MAQHNNIPRSSFQSPLYRRNQQNALLGATNAAFGDHDPPMSPSSSRPGGSIIHNPNQQQQNATAQVGAPASAVLLLLRAEAREKEIVEKLFFTVLYNICFVASGISLLSICFQSLLLPAAHSSDDASILLPALLGVSTSTSGSVWYWFFWKICAVVFSIIRIVHWVMFVVFLVVGVSSYNQAGKNSAPLDAVGQRLVGHCDEIGNGIGFVIGNGFLALIRPFFLWNGFRALIRRFFFWRPQARGQHQHQP